MIVYPSLVAAESLPVFKFLIFRQVDDVPEIFINAQTLMK